MAQRALAQIGGSPLSLSILFSSLPYDVSFGMF